MRAPSGINIALCVPAVLASLTGCGSAGTREAEKAALPFSVRLKEVRLRSGPEKSDAATASPDAQPASGPDASPPVNQEAREGPAAPPTFDKTWEVTYGFLRALEEANVFTRIVAPDDTKTPVDLELEIEADGADFGEGDWTVFGSITSTVVWLLAGHLSWFIDNREYPKSDVALHVSIRPVVATSETGGGASETSFAPPGEAPGASPSSPPASAAEPPGGKTRAQGKKRSSAKTKTAPSSPVRPAEAVFQDALRLNGLQLNFMERAGVSNWFLNIFIPPFVGNGSPETAGHSLTHRGIEHFGETEPERLVFSFPASYFRSTTRYLVPDIARESVVIVSRAPINAIAIRAEGRAERRIDGSDEVQKLWVQGEATEELRLSIADRVVGIAGGGGGESGTQERYYRVKLEPDEVGYVQVEASPPIGNVLSLWTIYRKPPAGAADGK